MPGMHTYSLVLPVSLSRAARRRGGISPHGTARLANLQLRIVLARATGFPRGLDLLMSPQIRLGDYDLLSCPGHLTLVPLRYTLIHTLRLHRPERYT